VNYFKKTTLILFLITLLGCSKDSKQEEIAFANLKGTWEAVFYSYDGSTEYNSINNNDSWMTSYHGDAWLLDFYLEITENPNEYSVIGTHKIDLYFTDENGVEHYYVGNQTKNEFGTYVRNSNRNISFNVNNDIKHGTILTLNDTTLIINISNSSSEFTSDNILETKQLNEYYTYKRIN
jgi:hypothetical protein